MKLDKQLNILASKFINYAIKNLYKGAICAKTDFTEDGFNVLFYLPKNLKLSTKNFVAIKNEVTKISKNNPKISYQSISNAEAKKLFKNNRYYLSEIGKSKAISIIKIGNFVDWLPCKITLNKLPNPKFLNLVNASGQYWQNDAKNEQLTAISGWIVKNDKEAKEFGEILKDRIERDHRKIGAELELFSFDPLIGPGLPIWLDNGFATKYVIENYCYELMYRNDYHFVECPVLGTTQLYKTSGHWDHYRENMFTPFKVDTEEYVLKPMNCPHHILIYKQKPRSYRELPYRVAEFGIQHRYESSGSLTGLERVRSMKLVDTHTVLMHSQIEEEIKKVYNVINEAHHTLGTSIYSIDLSLHDPKDTQKFFDNPKMWKSAEDQLRKALKALKVPYREVVGEAAFYGPKIDLQIKTALGHIVTVSTIQLDFLLPERFDLEYIDSKGKKQRPVFIHAGIIGTFERYIAILLEQTKGVLPLWLAPIQAVIIPVNSDKHTNYALKMKKELINEGFRVKVDESDNRLSYKIRDAQVHKIPYQIVIGDNEIKDENHMITYREYGKNNEVKIPFAKFKTLLKKIVSSRK